MLEIAGYALLPDWSLFLTFAAAGLALNIVPGADMTFVAFAAARGGRRQGIVASLGIGAGALVHIAAATLGLSAILASSDTAFTLIKWAGALYLVWVAWSLVHGAKSVRENGSQQPLNRSLEDDWRLFRAAILVNLLNPKVALFFLAFLPQFIDPEAASPALQIFCLGLWFDLVGTLVNVAVAMATANVAVRFKSKPLFGRIARWLAAGAMTGLALQLAFSRR